MKQFRCDKQRRVSCALTAAIPWTPVRLVSWCGRSRRFKHWFVLGNIIMTFIHSMTSAKQNRTPNYRILIPSIPTYVDCDFIMRRYISPQRSIRHLCMARKVVMRYQCSIAYFVARVHEPDNNVSSGSQHKMHTAQRRCHEFNKSRQATRDAARSPRLLI